MKREESKTEYERISRFYRENSDIYDRMVAQEDLRRMLPARNQTLNAAQKGYFGHIKVHVCTHMDTRLAGLFRARYATEFETPKLFEACCDKMLRNEVLSTDPPRWREISAEFRRDMRMDTAEGFYVCDAHRARCAMREAEDEPRDEHDVDVDDDQDGDDLAAEQAAAIVDDATIDETGGEMTDQELKKCCADLRFRWPIHVAAVFETKRVLLQQMEAYERSYEEAVRNDDEVPIPKFIKRVALLPRVRYDRGYVPIDEDVMKALVRIRNKEAAPSSPFKIPDGASALGSCVREPTLASRKALRQKLRRRARASKNKRRKHTRGAACGHGGKRNAARWPASDDAMMTSIRTDGVGVRIMFTFANRPCPRTAKTVFDASSAMEDILASVPREEVVIQGLDPGVARPAHAVAITLDGLPETPSTDPFGFWSPGEVARPSKTSMFSSKMYYSRALFDKQMRELTRRRDVTDGYRDACRALASTGTWRTADPEEFRAMCKVLNQHAAAFRAYSIDTVDVAKWRMLTFRRKRSVLDQVAQRFINDGIEVYRDRLRSSSSDTRTSAHEHKINKALPAAYVIAYGNASTANVRGTRSVPRIALKLALRRRLEELKTRNTDRGWAGVRVAMVSTAEKRTTALCHLCHNVMAKMRHRRRGDGNVVVSRDLRGCTHCGTDAGPMLRDRDDNAARNIGYKACMTAFGLTLSESWTSTEPLTYPSRMLPSRPAWTRPTV